MPMSFEIQEKRKSRRMSWSLLRLCFGGSSTAGIDASTAARRRRMSKSRASLPAGEIQTCASLCSATLAIGGPRVDLVMGMGRPLDMLVLGLGCVRSRTDGMHISARVWPSWSSRLGDVWGV
ncbi:hypothetical protein MRB53_037512 [Persea americana]|nr:hypothetical protein MRB53_037512 [Persea americana]